MCLCEQGASNSHHCHFVDGLGACKDLTKLNKVIDHLNKASEVRVGAENCYVGLHITMNRELRTLYIDQT
jgi:hypothetical protein